jgi:hypothetical protein
MTKLLRDGNSLRLELCRNDEGDDNAEITTDAEGSRERMITLPQINGDSWDDSGGDRGC